MQIVIDISDEDVPNKQEIIDISLHFIAGEVCECSYPYIILPKEHGRLIDADDIDNITVVHNSKDVLIRLEAPAILEATKEKEKN